MQSVPASSSTLFSLKAMGEEQDNLSLLNKLIAERENHFQRALSEAADYHLLNHLKKDLDFLKEKREELKRSLNNSSAGGK
jgi:hypothetical protein